MSWELFSRSTHQSRTFVYKREGAPHFLTPLYVASFSSFGDVDFGSRALATLRSLRLALPDSHYPAILLSAYDLKRRLSLEGGVADTGIAQELLKELAQGDVWQLDSGVYEKDRFQDSTWDLEDFLSVFRATRPPCVVTFDYRPADTSLQGFERALELTISSAKDALNGSQITLLAHFHAEAGLWEAQSSQREDSRIQELLKILTSALRLLDGRVAVLGVVESELGPGIRTRLRSIARLRKALGAADIEKPIHIFGASDPQNLALYSLAGANIFDGVNWSRYYLDTEDCCFRDKGLLSWKQPSVGEAVSLTTQWEMLGVSNILRMQKFTFNLQRLIETGQPQTTKEEAWCAFVMTSCGEIFERRD